MATAALGYYVGYSSAWIVGEVVRKRTEWIAERALREGCGPAELRQRLVDSRMRVNDLIRQLSAVLQMVDLTAAPAVEFRWLADPDDWPVMQTALAAHADILVTDNSRDFPLGETRNGVLLLGSRAFLDALYARFPDAEASAHAYLRG